MSLRCISSLCLERYTGPRSFASLFLVVWACVLVTRLGCVCAFFVFGWFFRGTFCPSWRWVSGCGCHSFLLSRLLSLGLLSRLESIRLEPLRFDELWRVLSFLFFSPALFSWGSGFGFRLAGSGCGFRLTWILDRGEFFVACSAGCGAFMCLGRGWDPPIFGAPEHFWT